MPALIQPPPSERPRARADSSRQLPAHPLPASSREDPRRALGRLGEELAMVHLQQLGFSSLERNVRTRHGEIDLVAFNEGTLVFAEVKTRRISSRPQRLRSDQQPLTWLGPRQRTRLRRLACAWLRDQTNLRPTAHTLRFDAIGVIVDTADRLVRLDHVEGAW